MNIEEKDTIISTMCARLGQSVKLRGKVQDMMNKFPEDYKKLSGDNNLLDKIIDFQLKLNQAVELLSAIDDLMFKNKYMEPRLDDVYLFQKVIYKKYYGLSLTKNYSVN